MIKKYAQAKVVVHDGIEWDGKARTQRIITEWIPECDIRMGRDQQLELIDPDTGRDLFAAVGSYILKNDKGRVFVLTGHNIEHNFTVV